MYHFKGDSIRIKKNNKLLFLNLNQSSNKNGQLIQNSIISPSSFLTIVRIYQHIIA